MNKFLTLLILLAVHISDLNAQILQPYKAKDGIQTVASTVKSVASDAKLMVVATITGQIPNSSLTFTFDEIKGTCSAWLYIFHSPSKDSNYYYLGAKTLLGFTAIEAPIDPAQIQLPFIPDSSLDNRTWIDSDKMIASIHKSDKYITFKAKNSDAALSKTGVGIDPQDNTVLWGVTISSKTGDLNCIVNAETSETTCFEMTSVEQVNNSKISIVPNPVSEIAVLSIPIEYSYNKTEVSIFDQTGQIVKAYTSLDLNSLGQTSLSVKDLPNGVYHLIFSNGLNSDACSFVISR